MTAVQRAQRALFLVATTLGLIGGALGLAATAGAHAALIASDPSDNAELQQPPAAVSATFNEAMQPQFAAMTVIGPDGTQWSDGDPTVDGAVISVAVRPGGPAGSYTVNYRATSADGHVVTGSWSYRVTVGAATAPTSPPAPATAENGTPPAQAQASDDGVPVWPFVAGATVLVAAGALWAVRRQS